MTEDISGDIVKVTPKIADAGGGGGFLGGHLGTVTVYSGGESIEKNEFDFENFENISKPAITVTTASLSSSSSSSSSSPLPLPPQPPVTTTTATTTTTTTTEALTNNNQSNVSNRNNGNNKNNKNNNNNTSSNNMNKNNKNTSKNAKTTHDATSISIPTPTPPAPPSIFLCNNPVNCVTLKQILESLKTPIVEEQAWALIYQFAALYRKMVFTGVRQVFSDNEIPAGIEHLNLHRDGSVHCSWAENLRRSVSERELRQHAQQTCRHMHKQQRQFKKEMERLRGPYSHAEVIASHEKILHKLAVIVYTALDYNLLEYEQCNISQELEDLITHMTVDEDGSDSNAINDDDNIDEGIADETEENEKFCDTKVFDYVLEVCKNHIKPTVPEDHYRAVCRALATETIELRIFLQHVLDNGTDTLHMKLNSDASKQELAKLGFVDWARFWVQVIDELRRGVRLKKSNYERAPIEYELTPYEILMEDIRAKKYQLRKVMVNGDIPPRVKKDAHAVILEFIRSRPPLKKASERQLPPPIKRTPSPRELLLDSIRKGRTLKHIQPSSPRLKDRLLPPTAATASTTTAAEGDKTLTNQSMSASATALTAPTEPTEPTRTSKAEEIDSTSVHTTPRTKQRLIKVDFSLLQDDDHFFDTFGRNITSPNIVNVNPVCSQPKMPPYPIGGYMTCNVPATTTAPSKQLQTTTTRELRRTTYDLATQCESRRASLRRHTIVGCQSNLDETRSMPPSRPESRLSDVHNIKSEPDDGILTKQQHNKFNQQQQQYLKRSQSPTGTDEGNSRRSSSSIGPWNRSFLDEKTWNERGDDRLSLTLEEIVHIRSVITKANLEALPVGIGVKEDVEKRKVCFLCLRTRFSIFGPWGIQCKLCQRTVCSKCYTKMRIPSEHLRKVPLVLISPSLLASPASSSTPSPSHHASQHAVHASSAENILDETFPKTLIERLLRSEAARTTVGSAPSSPKNQRSNISTPGGIMTSSAAAAAGQAMEALHDKSTITAHTSMYVANGGHCINNKHINIMSRSMEGPRSLPANSPARPHSNSSTLDRRSKFSRAFMLSSSGTQLAQDQKENMRGELVAVCFDCKGLVMEITNSSKQTRSTARNRALQNLTLDLSPVYK